MANVAILMLAAGNSSRMGQPKQLLDYGGTPLIRHAAQAALASLARPVIVVCGQLEPQIRYALSGLDVVFASNPRWAGGMGTSIQAGLHALVPFPVQAAIITLADMPLLTAASYNNLITASETVANTIVTSEYAGTVGVPVLFPTKFFPDLLALAPEQGCKGVIQSNGKSVLRLPCPEAGTDIDTPAGYAAVLGALTAR